MARRFSQYGDEEAALRCHERAEMVTDMIGQLREGWGMANAEMSHAHPKNPAVPGVGAGCENPRR
jgi:hypothetical protein